MQQMTGTDLMSLPNIESDDAKMPQKKRLEKWHVRTY